MLLKRKQVVLLLLIALLSLAVYLNVRYRDDGGQFDVVKAAEAAKNLGEAKLVSGEGDDKEGSGVPVLSPGGDYFVQARLTRQKTRDEAVELLRSVAESENASEENRQKALSDLTEIAAAVETEGRVENLITAKGFSEAAAFINGGSISVVVRGPSLDSTQVARIKDIVISEAGIASDNIKVMSVD